MRRRLLAVSFALISCVVCFAQEARESPRQVAAHVRQLKGTCFVRNRGSENRKRVKVGQQLRAGEELSCSQGGSITISFANGSDRDIKTILPNWYLVPNAPNQRDKTTRFKIAGRSKGNDPVQSIDQNPVKPEPRATSAIESDGLRLADVGGLDDADIFWKSRRKYFLIVTPTRTGGLDTELPFTKIDGDGVTRVLTAHGYEKLNALYDEFATEANLVKELRRARDFDSSTVLVVYYSGHAAMDPLGKDLWLQLYGQEEFGDHLGISLSQIIGATRGDSFRGDLILILDSCYSGQGTVSPQISLREADRTVIFASSTAYQPSYSVKSPSGIETSAFTHYLLQGLETDWPQVDEDHDGIILYSDLQIYIGIKLRERLRDETLLGSMQPQLVGQSPHIWAAYDSKRAQNFGTQQRKNLRLERLSQIRDPEKVWGMIKGPLPESADPYLRALEALESNRFDEALGLLEIAEKHGQVHKAEIFWARAQLSVKQRNHPLARDWFEKALLEAPKPTVALVHEAALINLEMGYWTRAEELFEQILARPRSEIESKGQIIDALVGLALMKVSLGSSIDGEKYLRKLKSFDAKTLDDHEDGLSALVAMLEALADVRRGDKETARLKVESIRQTLPTLKQEMQKGLHDYLQMIELAIAGDEDNTESLATLPQAKLLQWEEIVRKGDANPLIIFLNEVQILSYQRISEFVITAEIESLLVKTVQLSREHRSRTAINAGNNASQSHGIEASDNLRLAAIESAQILTSVADIYILGAKRDVAEKFLKEAIALEDEFKKPLPNLSTTLKLGALYEDEGKYSEAEALYQKFLLKLQPSGNDHNVFAHSMLRTLGELYEAQDKWEKAEQAYRSMLDLTVLESNTVFAFAAKEKMAKFLFDRGRYADAVPLLKQAIEWHETNRAVAADLLRKDLALAYFDLARSYYWLKDYKAAEPAFQKSSELFTTQQPVDLINSSSCLVWRWFTADALKRPDEAKRLYAELISISEAEVNKAKPDSSFAYELETYAGWFGDFGEYSLAEPLLHLALRAEQKNYGPQHFAAARVWRSFAFLAQSDHQYKKSLEYLEKAKAIYLKDSPLDTDSLAEVYYNIGFAHYRRSEFQSAAEWFQRATEMLKEKSSPFEVDHEARFFLGRVQRLSGKLSEARATFESVLRLDQKAVEPREARVLEDLLELAAISRLERKFDQAESYLTMANHVLSSNKISGIPPAIAHETAMLLFARGHSNQADLMIRKALRDAENINLDPILTVEWLENYAAVLRKRGKLKEANQQEKEALQIRNAMIQ